MFILWQATNGGPWPCGEALAVGVRVSGRNAVDYLVNITSEGLSYAREDVSGMPAVIEFDPEEPGADRVRAGERGHHPGRPRGGRPVPELVLPDLKGERRTMDLAAIEAERARLHADVRQGRPAGEQRAGHSTTPRC